MPSVAPSVVTSGTHGDVSSVSIVPSPLVSTWLQVIPGPPALEASRPVCVPSIQLES